MKLPQHIFNNFTYQYSLNYFGNLVPDIFMVWENRSRFQYTNFCPLILFQVTTNRKFMG